MKPALYQVAQRERTVFVQYIEPSAAWIVEQPVEAHYVVKGSRGEYAHLDLRVY